MEFKDISFWRMQSQQLLTTNIDSIPRLVKHFGAIQAQDYAMAKWAIGSRVPSISDADVDIALASGDIVRTHVLRPTWHFAPSEDIGWMLGLTAKTIRGQMASNDRKLGLDQAIYNKSFGLIEKALEDGHLSKPEIMEILEFNGIRTHEYRSGHIMAAAELEGLVVSGARKGKEHGYALMSKQVKKPRKLSKEEALAELAQTYFKSHAPATVRDFQWWSGLNLTDCRTGIKANEKKLESVEIEGQTYYFPEEHQSVNTKSVHLLPAFDEFLIAYKDRTPSIDPVHSRHAFTSNGIFKPLLVVDGQVCGIWKRTIKKDVVSVEVQAMVKIPNNRFSEIEHQVKRFGDFLGLKTDLKL
ncbi:winged helix DNA-binding domain-containing protein [Flavobacterium sp. MAH-1]|uniref:Winged helix DNA-binding domain-containing protein n=1 Tax=Flavobacterium agri TaxID=2743471 RepID=A0A7Y8Y2G3_9FLAO|nr:winged helix DNA-binding domain-containing protein [Flavobacterium agri]NUY81173.1 winged helix DNA-binding domain-containing protein [Flavobacterium agri]NYA71197.1 winged helix DNA-binding domain-containing protein [Flavobacterium agri]